MSQQSQRRPQIGVRWPQPEYDAIKAWVEQRYQGDLSFMVRKAVAELMKRDEEDAQRKEQAA
jgi:hypothetical protein